MTNFEILASRLEVANTSLRFILAEFEDIQDKFLQLESDYDSAMELAPSICVTDSDNSGSWEEEEFDPCEEEEEDGEFWFMEEEE
jgi:hypothetical protein